MNEQWTFIQLFYSHNKLLSINKELQSQNMSGAQQQQKQQQQKTTYYKSLSEISLSFENPSFKFKWIKFRYLLFYGVGQGYAFIWNIRIPDKGASWINYV